MKSSEAIKYIENCKWYNDTKDLSSMHRLMETLGNPQNDLKIIHVAGSNGKGSCVAMLTSILIKAGYKTGSFISPHLINYEERFLINNEQIKEIDFVRLVKKVKTVCDKSSLTPTVFEILTATSFLYFKEQKCDVCVIEVGLGGRLDATNVIDKSELSIIMNIGLEHTNILGNTLEKIAKEKAGIIKHDGDVLVYNVNNTVNKVYKKICKEKKSKLTIVDFSKIKPIKTNLDYQIFNYDNYSKVKLKLIGYHQLNNAAVVIEACKLLNNKGYKLAKKNIYDGLANVKWDARLSVLSKEPLFILDGAHNPQCVKALSDSLTSLVGNKKITLLCGMLKDKDYKKSLSYILPYAKKIITVTVPSIRSLSADELKKYLVAMNKDVIAATSIKEGIKLALEENDCVVCFGSLYLAGEVEKDFLNEYKNYLRRKLKVKREKLNYKKKEEYSKEICKKIKANSIYKKAKNILIYNSINNEVDLSYLTGNKNKTFAYPLCYKNNIIPLVPNDTNSFKVGNYGIKEPIKNKSKIMKSIDLVIVPLVGYDINLNRLGNGKGYYDRFLNKNKYKTIGVGYSFQEVEELPTNNYDYKLDLIINEKKIIKKQPVVK